MRIACLQYAPLVSLLLALYLEGEFSSTSHNVQTGDINQNMNRAEAVLSRSNLDGIDLLVLPELAFSGTKSFFQKLDMLISTGADFQSLQHVTPFVEPTAAGISSFWARTAALKHSCTVVVGYPERISIILPRPGSFEYYNSSIVIDKKGDTIANFRKSFLYHTDGPCVSQGPDEIFDGGINGLGNVTLGRFQWTTDSFERMSRTNF